MYGIQGIVAMGSTSSPNFLDLAYSANQISSPVFALEINTQKSGIPSVMHYNTLPTSIINNSVFVNVPNMEYWHVNIIGLTVG